MRTTGCTVLLVVLAIATIAPAPAPAQAPVDNAFTYQGQLKLAGTPIDGLADFEFTLWDDPISTDPSDLVAGPVPETKWVDNGLFTVVLDFGEDVFTGEARWLEIVVNGTTLSPRQELTPAPYALYALSGPGAGFALPYSGSVADAGDAFAITNTGTGDAIRGVSASSGNFGYLGSPSEGVLGKHNSSQNRGGLGYADYGAYGWHEGGGNIGYLGGLNYGVEGRHASGNHGYVGHVDYGVYGKHDASGNYGYWGHADYGMYGRSETTAGSGVYGFSLDTIGRGVWGLASATSGTNYGVYGQTGSADGYGGYFEGRGYFSGNVGIGMTSPGEKLDVDGTVRMTGFQLTTGATDGYVLTTDLSGAGTWQPAPTTGGYWSANGDDIYKNNPGRVGIGTSDPDGVLHGKAANYSWTPLFERFNVTSNQTWAAMRLKATNSDDMGDGFGVGLAFQLADNEEPGTNVGLIGAKRAGADNTADLVFQTYSGGSQAESMRITSNGDVGIGTTTPAEQLHVYSGSDATIRVGGDSNGDDAELQLFGNSTAGSEDGIALGWDGSWLRFKNWNNGVSGSTLMRMGGTWGQIGIGGDHIPLAPLHVEGTVRMTGLQVTDAPQPGYVLTCNDINGVASWQPPGDFTLPYSGSVAAAGAIALDVANSGVGTGTVAVRGYASAASGTNYGVVGISNSPDGYAGWFTGNTWFAGNTTIDTPGPGKIEFRGDDGLTPAINIDGGYAGTLRLRRALEIWPNDAETMAGYFDVRDPNGAIQIALDGTDGRVTTNVLEITGGSDLSEQFDVSTGKETPLPGMVVCIDPKQPGKLVVSTRAYDRTVAGVISGAGGVQTGMLMGQKNSAADGEHPVALTGRVYVLADASNGPIQPGDLLTTSDTPGHAMRVSDYGRAQGAIIGKAMTALEDGEGLVLVLVTLQ